MLGLPESSGYPVFEIEVPVGAGSKNRLTILASLRNVAGRSDDNETLFAGHNVVSVLLHSNLCKPMLYNGLFSFPLCPGSPPVHGCFGPRVSLESCGSLR